MADEGAPDNENMEDILNRYGPVRAPAFDFKPWVDELPEYLEVYDKETLLLQNRACPMSVYSCEHYWTRRSNRESVSERKHKSNQMTWFGASKNGITHYSVENSFFVKEGAKGGWVLRGVKNICKSEQGAWRSWSYSNFADADDPRLITVLYPTGDNNSIIDVDVDTKINHRGAVEAAVGQVLPFYLCVTYTKYVFGFVKVENPWIELDGGQKAYRVRLILLSDA